MILIILYNIIIVEVVTYTIRTVRRIIYIKNKSLSMRNNIRHDTLRFMRMYVYVYNLSIFVLDDSCS